MMTQLLFLQRLRVLVHLVSPSGDYQVSRLSCEPGAMYDAISE